jgi:hypothetical protein
MRYCVVSVRDLAARVYAQPQFCAAPEQALRGFRDQVKEVNAPKENIVAAHPEDFELFHLGWFDDSECKFELFDLPRLITRAVEL